MRWIHLTVITLFVAATLVCFFANSPKCRLAILLGSKALVRLALRGFHAIGRRVWKCLRIAKQAAAAARCLSVCPLTRCPVE
jgi:hypothetical protein